MMLNYELKPFIHSGNYAPAYPSDRKPGCNFRKYQPGYLFPMASERITIIDRADWPKYVGKVTMANHVKVILDQGQVGSCATEGTAQALMICRSFMGLPHVVLNPWFIYHHTSGGVDAGSSIDENLSFIQENGIAPMEVWGRDKGWRAKPSEEAYRAAKDFMAIEAYDITSVDEMVSALCQNYAVVWGANGHCVVKVEHLNERQGKDINSWGPNWGTGGFGVWATYSAINWGYGAYAIRWAKT